MPVPSHHSTAAWKLSSADTFLNPRKSEIDRPDWKPTAHSQDTLHIHQPVATVLKAKQSSRSEISILDDGLKNHYISIQPNDTSSNVYAISNGRVPQICEYDPNRPEIAPRYAGFPSLTGSDLVVTWCGSRDRPGQSESRTLEVAEGTIAEWRDGELIMRDMTVNEWNIAFAQPSSARLAATEYLSRAAHAGEARYSDRETAGSITPTQQPSRPQPPSAVWRRLGLLKASSGSEDGSQGSW